MSDLIDRDKAIDVLDDFQSNVENCVGNAYAIARQQMIAIPSARQQEGKWIEVEWYPIAVPSKWYENDEKPIYASKLQCPKCGFTRNFLDGHTAQYNFCPQCGADMRERKDFQVIVNGNCTKCGKPLSGNRIFICKECEEQSKERE